MAPSICCDLHFFSGAVGCVTSVFAAACCFFGYSFWPVPFGQSSPLGLLLTLISVPRAWQKGKQSWQFKLKLFAASQQQAVKPKNDQRKKPVSGNIGAKNKMKESKNRRGKN